VPPAHAKGAVPPYDAGARLDVGLVNLAEPGAAQLMANYLNGYNQGSGK
jgi:hypothetical protein